MKYRMMIRTINICISKQINKYLEDGIDPEARNLEDVVQPEEVGQREPGVDQATQSSTRILMSTQIHCGQFNVI